MANPIWNPIDGAPADKVIIAGRPTPGFCELHGVSSPRNWEEMTPGGWSGGILIFKGIKLSHFSIRCEVFDDPRDPKTGESVHWNEWHALRPLLLKAPLGKVPRSLECSHPLLAQHGISALVVDDLYAPIQTDHGVWLIEISCIEWRKLRATGTAKPEGAVETPESEWQKEARRLDEENKKLEAALKAQAGEGNMSVPSILESLGL